VTETALFAAWGAFAGVALLFMIFVPWTQSVTGSGAVTAFSPMQRPQTVNAEIDARLASWKVHEGDVVSAGQVLAELAEMRPRTARWVKNCSTSAACIARG
jgi:multidrug efflux pump subunit AcrA (membrane-fusion protein)